MSRNLWPGNLGIPKYRCRQCDQWKFVKDFTIHIHLRSGEMGDGAGQTCNQCRVKSASKTGLYLEEGTLWRAEGACVGEDPELWFSAPSSVGAIKAATICQGCPVKALCATYAAEQKLEGIWGGKFYPSPVGRRPGPPHDVLTSAPPRRGADNMLKKGWCTKRLHRIQSLEDVYMRTDGAMRCKACWDDDRPLRTEKMRERREAARVREAARS